MENTLNIRFLLVVILAFCSVAAMAAVILIAVKVMGKQNSAKQEGLPVSEALPGGGGAYTMELEGMSCEHCKAAVEDALNAFEGVHADADPERGIVYITYAGYPDLGLLDRLRGAAEEAGFTVKEIR